MKLTASQQRKVELLRVRQLYRQKLQLSFDANHINSRPTEKQSEILKSTLNCHYVIGSNRSGKSQLGARAISWFFENNHPYLERPPEWGDGPITILFVGQVQEQMESALWVPKVERFLEPGSYKPVKQGGSISRIEHKTNGNRIIFISHQDSEAARKKAQGYAAHVIWLDEMPNKASLLSELRARVLDTNGFMYCTFTPLLRNIEIKKIVDGKSPNSKKWFISVLDNPVFESRKDEIVAEFRAMSSSEAEFQARLNGQWMTGDNAVFLYDSERHWRSLPDGYEPHLWPHVAVVDPAASGQAGLTVYAREPDRDIWYCIMARYLRGDAFSRMVPEIESIIKKFNIVKRICDCNPSGFYKEAHIHGIKYFPITEKSYNKENSIDEANNALSEGRVFMSTGADLLIDELVTCARSEDNPDRIIKASKYHTADTFRYFVQLKPAFNTVKSEPRVEERTRRAWKERLTHEQNYVTTRMRQFARDGYLL